MAITTQINIAIIDHKTSTGKDAERIYLGHNQMTELRQWADAHIYHKIDTPNETKRQEYGGRQIYEVDDDNHLAVA